MIKVHNSVFFLSLFLIISLFIIRSNPILIIPLILLFLLFKARIGFYLILALTLLYSNHIYSNDILRIEKSNNKNVVLKYLRLLERQGNKAIMKSDFGTLLVGTGKDFKPEFGKIYKQVPCTLQKTESTSNFFCFNYSNYLRSKKVFFNTFISKTPQSTDNFSINKSKEEIFSSLFSDKKDDKKKLLALSMTLGLKEAKKHVYEMFSKFGLNHLIAFSGTHLSIFIMLFSFYKRHNIFTLFIPVFFLIFCFSPSLLRASFIFYMNFIASRYNRQAYILEWIGWFSIIYILINPYIIYDPSFIFSYLFFSQLIFFKEKKNSLLLIFSIETMFINGSLYILFPIMTLIFMFILPYLILSGLLWTVSGFRFDHLLFLYDLVVKILENDIFKYIYYITPFSIAGFLLLIIVLRSADFRYRIILMMIYFSVFLYIVFFPYMLIFDTGHGQTIFVNTPCTTFLLDAGNSHFYVEDSIIAFLDLFSISIDHAIISHDDWDHYSGIRKLYEQGYVKNIYAGRSSSLSENDIPFTSIDRIDVKTFPRLRLSGRRLNNIGTDNQISLFFCLEFFNRKTLIFSDLEAQEIFQNLSKDFDVENVVVGHHGSSGALSEELISLWDDPDYFISCSKKFNNPHSETLGLLKENKVYTTREKGAILVDLTTGLKIFSGK